jgi:Flp pilus assembly protein TadG
MKAMRRSERGAVTVEAAFASVGLVALLAVLVSAIGVVLVQVQCVDAAGAIARQAARGDTAAVAEAEGQLPKDGHVVIRSNATTVTVRVEARASVVPGSSLTVDLSAETTAVLEPGGSS